MSLNNKTTSPDDPDNKKDSSCYFCNDSFEAGQLQIHLKHCGSILEQCPLRCGAWIQRRHRATHAHDCPQSADKRRSAHGTLPSHARPPEPTPEHTWSVQLQPAPPPPAPPAPPPVSHCINFLEKEVASIRLSMTEELNHRQIQTSELDTLKTKFQLAEERMQHFLATLHTLRNSIDDEAERTANVASQFKHDISNIQLTLQELQSAQMSTALRLESAVSSLVHEQHERELLEQVLTQHENKMKMLHSLESAIEYLKRTVSDERAREAEGRAVLAAELEEARRSSQHLSQLTALRLDLQHQAAASEYQAVDRLAVVELAARQARGETEEQAARADALARDLRALSKSYLKLRNDFTDFKSKMTFEPQNDLGSDNGHLIWKIENYSSKMKEARESGTALSGPLFRTAKYGYTLKPEVHLNGIGKWLGRHVTATVRLVGGPYDTLLRWPCDLHLNIVLKDQAAKKSEAMDIVKSLQIRRKSSSKKHDYDDPGEDKSRSAENLADKSPLQMKRQYIFIPHASLDKFDYIAMDIVKSLQIRRKSSSKKHDYDDPGEEKSRSAENLADKSPLQMKRQYIFIPHASLDKFDYIVNDTAFVEFVVTQ